MAAQDQPTGLQSLNPEALKRVISFLPMATLAAFCCTCKWANAAAAAADERSVAYMRRLSKYSRRLAGWLAQLRRALEKHAQQPFDSMLDALAGRLTSPTRRWRRHSRWPRGWRPVPKEGPVEADLNRTYAIFSKKIGFPDPQNPADIFEVLLIAVVSPHAPHCISSLQVSFRWDGFAYLVGFELSQGIEGEYLPKGFAPDPNNPNESTMGAAALAAAIRRVFPLVDLPELAIFLNQ